MPVYSYRCNDPKCSEITEAYSPMPGARLPGKQHTPDTVAQAPACAVCGGETHKIIVDFPECKIDYKAWYTRDEGYRMVLHPSRAGKHSPASEVAGKRT